ncbi:hypothetical protein MGYG_00541 [Nannizzia gypsea CBS 118893]|uniref:Uncharacterized protein n=1 Tax=Arthroderma gypseum (strain ATCC MYA-4604 / CBS 118893) TaxID=535722 RepID=E5R0E2_ARTGP|nr:hypothetical protein MGYG_00541 [Nannizzia gypsea CBS 118893]EFQ97501.1 hypothetical protein MGYG_00541 [Nannizzia gypsea CBS 118893]
MSNVPTPPPSYRESAQTPAPPPLGRPELSPLTLDGNLIYPVAPPTTALYELTHELDAGYRKIGISRLCPNRNTAQYGIIREKHIYDFSQPIFSSSVEITGKRQSCLSAVLCLRMSRGIIKRGWELFRLRLNGQADDLVFRIRPTRSPEKQETLQWEDADQSLVAVETVCIPGGANVRPVLHIVRDMDDRLIDALITAWCAKIWIGHQFAAGEMKNLEADMVTGPMEVIMNGCLYGYFGHNRDQ